MSMQPGLLQDTLLRLPGIALLGGSAWAMASGIDAPLRLATVSGLAAVGCACMLLQSARPGQLPSRRLDDPRKGSFLVGHGVEDRLSVAISLPWSVLDKGLTVEGPAAARADYLAGLAIQAAATGRPVVILSFDAARSTETALTDAALRIDLSDDVWIIGGEAANARLDPFRRLPLGTVVALVSDACPALHGEGTECVQARLLLPAAAALFQHMTGEGSQDPDPQTFEDCLSLAMLTDAVDPKVTPQNYPSAATKAEVARYLACLPGHVTTGKQPTSVLAAHAAAAGILKDGLAVIRGVCAGDATPIAGDDLIANGRILWFRLESNGGARRAEAFVVDLVSTMIRMRPGLSPIVLMDGFCSLPPDLAAKAMAMRGIGAGVALGVIEGTATGTSTTVALHREEDGAGRLHANGSVRVLHPLPLSDRRSPRRTSSIAALQDGRVNVHPPEGRLEYSTESYDVLKRLTDEEFTVPEPAPDRTIEEILARMRSDPIEGWDHSAALALLRTTDHAAAPEVPPDAAPQEPASERDRACAAFPEAPEGIDEFGEFGEFDLSKDFPFPPPFDFGSPPEFASTASAPVAASVGRSPFPVSLRNDAGLATGGWHRVAGVPLRRTSLNGDEFAQLLLDMEFPQWKKATARIVASLKSAGSGPVRPLLLLGPRGIGKTRYARRICEAFSLEWACYPCGTASDASFLGASRQWNGARPGFVPALMARTRSLNPAIVLDGFDAAPATDGGTGLPAAIRPLLDPETSSRYHDPYLDVQVDLSTVIWIATASEPGGIPADVREAFRIEELPAPGEDMTDALVSTILPDLAEGKWALDTDAFSKVVETVRPAWGGGSVRRLKGLVDDALQGLGDPASKGGR
jgi:hypothetical protein